MTMKAYKGFNKDMTCRGFQFEEGKTYEEKEAKLCHAGFHACLNPLDCMGYYFLNDSVYHEVELDGVSDERHAEDTKVAAKKITIGARLDIAGMVKGAIDFVFASVKKDMNGATKNDDNSAQMASSGYSAQMASSGYSAQMASSGDYAQMASSGYYAKMASSGYYAKMASSGDYAQMASSGDYAQMASSGYYAKMASSGYYAQMASSGYSAKMASSGDYAKMELNGENSVGAAIGIDSFIKGKVGCWITLAEYDEDCKVVCVKSAQIDGDKIKADTWYKLLGGEFVEVED